MALEQCAPYNLLTAPRSCTCILERALRPVGFSLSPLHMVLSVIVVAKIILLVGDCQICSIPHVCGYRR